MQLQNWRNKHESNVQEIGALTISNCLVLPMTIIPKGDSYQIWTDTYSLKASGTNHYTKEPFLFYFIILYSEIRSWTQSNRLWSYCATVTLLRFYLFIKIVNSNYKATIWNFSLNEIKLSWVKFFWHEKYTYFVVSSKT